MTCVLQPVRDSGNGRGRLTPSVAEKGPVLHEVLDKICEDPQDPERASEEGKKRSSREDREGECQDDNECGKVDDDAVQRDEGVKHRRSPGERRELRGVGRGLLTEA